MQKSRRFLALSLVTIILLVFGIAAYRNKNINTMTEAFAAEMTMEPTKYDSAGMDLDTGFVFSAQSPLNPRFIQENLVIEPDIDYTVKKNGQKVLVIPKEPLEPQKIYKFSIASKTQVPPKWAFQTKGDFQVVSTFPRDKSSGIPTNTGIEIVFSHLNFGQLEDFFTINPKVAGTFEVHKKTAVFVPKKLEPETIYTVTIKKGIPLEGSSQVLDEDLSFQFETSGESREDYSFNFYKPISEFPVDDKPVLQFNYYSWDSNTLAADLEFEIYKYKDAHEYIKALGEKQKIPYWAYRSQQNYIEDSSKLQSAIKFTSPIIEYDNTKFVEFPEALPPGYYLAETSIRDIRRQVWFQVTDLSTYTAVDKNHSYIWANDLSTGSPISNAKIQLWNSNESTVTDKKGLARLATPKENSSGIYAVISKDNKEGVVAISPWPGLDPQSEAQREFAQDYWKYLYLDRTLYKPNDTVHFWGLIKPRNKNTKLPDKVTVSLASVGWRDNPLIDSKEIPLDGFSFIDSMKLPNLIPGWYHIEVKCEDYVIAFENFEVETYSKPAYTIDVVPSKKALYVGDRVDFEVNASFFEGTPAANIPLQYHIPTHGNGNAVTDDKGSATISYSPNFLKGQYGSVIARQMFLITQSPESGEISASAAYHVLNNDISIDAANKVEGKSATVEMVINRLTVDKVNSGQAEPWDLEAFKDGPVANHPMSVKVFREVWEKREDGEYYDFINKKVIPRYFYEYKKVLETEGQTITDQNGKAIFKFPLGDRESYIVEISAQDFKGNPANCEHRVLGPHFQRQYNYSWYYLEGERYYGSEEEVSIFMKKNEATVSSHTDGFLFLTAQEGIMDAEVQDSPEFNTVFKADLIPNFAVRGVYFDGRNYHEAPDFPISYDKGEKALKINIKTDKEEYKPKDTVKVEFEVVDNEDTPVEALVNVNLVDEALYALRDRQVDILSRLYQDVYSSGIKASYYTHETPDMLSGGAEQGGEGGSERRDFKDAVLFETLHTDKKGKAQISFQVPDNLTSWRLTCQAVTDDLRAATENVPVVVKLPFFVDMAVNNTYLVGDKPAIPLRAFGDELRAGELVTYEGILKTDGKTKTFDLSGKAHTMVLWSLPPLEKGKYELTVTGKADGGLIDTLTLGFDVVESLMTKQQVDFWLLDKALKPKGAENTPTSLTFTDYERSQYLNMLLRLRWSGGSRIDQKIAPYIAKRLLEQYFPNTLLSDEPEENLDLAHFQTDEGGIALLPYGGADLELSAKLAALCSHVFDKSALADYFFKIAQDPTETRERSIIAISGLTALGEPSLTELKILSEQQDLTVKEQLYMALGFLQIGDEPSAAKWIKNILKQKGEDLGAQLRINTGQDQDHILEATALASVISAGLDMDEQNRLQAYLQENTSKDILLYTEQLMFLEKTLPRLPEEVVSFQYLLEGKREKISLKPGEAHSLLLSPEKLDTLKFDNIKGKVGITAVYLTAFDPLSERISDEIKIMREYEAPGKAEGSFDMNDLIKINISYEFNPKAPDGPYIITDFLPAGLKIVNRPHYHGEGDIYTKYPISIDGQKVIFLAHEKRNWHFNYYARVINPGDFKAEPATAQQMKSGKVYGVTAKTGMSIK